jgi:hypothetical protein
MFVSFHNTQKPSCIFMSIDHTMIVNPYATKPITKPLVKKSVASPMGKKGLVKAGHPVYLVIMQDNVTLLFSKKSANNEDGPYMAPVLDRIRNDSAFAEHHDIYGVFNMRAANGANIARPGTTKTGKYTFPCLVCLMQNTEGKTHQQVLANVRQWAAKCIRSFNQMGKNFAYEASFFYYGDVTPKQGPVPPDRYLLNDDLLTIIEECYPLEENNKEERAHYCGALYFADAQLGFQTLLAYSPGPASDSGSTPANDSQGAASGLSSN